MPVRVADPYNDPRIAEICAFESPGPHDFEFYIRLAAELGAWEVIDLGSGTGVLAVELAGRGLSVVGIDPGNAMLEVARRRDGGDRVTWIHGTAADMSSSAADLVLMTGHVSQVFVEDDDWLDTLAHSQRALRDRGHLAFEMRDPRARPWTGWTRTATEQTYAPPGRSPITSWVETTAVDGSSVTFDAHTVFAGTGEELVATSTLRFRTQEELEESLTAAAFRVDAIYGWWDRRPVGNETRELIVVASKA